MTLESLGFALETTDGRLGLRDLRDPRVKPLSVDFLDPAFVHRLRQGVSKNQPLGRALGARSDLRVFDATAGLGTDAFFIAALGCRVRGVERHPAVVALLQDALVRLRSVVAAGEAPSASYDGIVSRLSFESGSSLTVLSELAEEARPDVVYFDPMYPEEGRSDSALPKKGMQMFRRLIGEDTDVEAVFAMALSRARERVVVKRPVRAPPLGKPTHSFEGKTARFDMYLMGRP